MPGRDVIQRLWALLDQQRRCSDGLKSFQDRLTIRAGTHVYLWPILKLNFVDTGQDIIISALKTVAYLSREKLSLLPADCP